VQDGRIRCGAVLFSVCSSYAHHPHPKPKRLDYQDDVDYFAVCCPANCSVYLVPIADLPLRTYASLRIEPPRNNQRKFIRDAEKYEVGRVG
jgi:hypothetical protein